jgi:peptidoglycan/xylan/chitin deacetylase (PgdA/CDA1 family)
MTRVLENFTQHDYRNLVTSFLDLSYKVVSFHDVEANAPHVVLRHDIDLSLKHAAHLAKIENKLGVKATYFVLARSSLYNVWAPESLHTINSIMDLGHEIGLHFDASLYPSDANSLQEAASIECEHLENCIQCPIQIISFHRPAKSLLNYSGLLAGRRHAYEPDFFSEIGYCSDSRGAWNYGHPLETDAIKRKTALQLLTHPIWWCSELPRTREEILVDVLKQKEVSTSHAIADTITGYDAETGRILK